MNTPLPNRILTVAGSDSGGGAGIQADLKVITVLGGFGMSVITALTAQNTVGVHGIHPVPLNFITKQMDAVLSDIGADAAKTGMLATPEIVTTVADGIKRHKVAPLVVDPVMIAKSGDALLAEDARETLKAKLLPLASAVTPNLPEAEVLCGFTVDNMESMREAARRIHALGPRWVVIKGGHLEGRAVDLLYDGDRFDTYDAPRLDQRNTHGTGCSFSAALATLLGRGLSIRDAVGQAKQFITRAIAAGLAVGAGHGPTDPYSHIRSGLDREQMRADLAAALDRLIEKPFGDLIPEVRSNLGYALPGATGYDDVAGIPGRITQVGERVLACREPAFGACRHVARVIMAAMERYPHLRSAINIRHNPGILKACRRAGFQIAVFDRSVEPRVVKEKEGSTLEWGTRAALAKSRQAPDMVCDDGDMGKEPMIRVLGATPIEVVEKLERIFASYRAL